MAMIKTQRNCLFFAFIITLIFIIVYFAYFDYFDILFKVNVKLMGIYSSLILSNDFHTNTTDFIRPSTDRLFTNIPNSISIDILIIFAKADEETEGAKKRFYRTMSSLLNRSSTPINLHIVADNASRLIADQIFVKPDFKNKDFTRRFYDLKLLSKEIGQKLGSDLLQYFRFSPNSYYGDSLFFLSLVTGDLFPHLNRVIKIDSDLLVRADIAELWSYFNRFSFSQRFGFAREQQPVYRHMFYTYRLLINVSTLIGDPPPNGITGFNSGVILLDLEKIRSSTKPSFRALIRLENIQRLVEKYKFRGHLGDQDLYTLLSIENPELFYILPCQWNRQLCQWWRKHGYADVFDQYFNCSKPIKIYHGNCQTPFPALPDD